MTCQHFEADLVDLARGSLARDEAESPLRHHLGSCAACAARFERERQLTAGLQALTAATAAPENACAERRLMEAFAVRRPASDPSRRLAPIARWSALATAASVLLFLGLWAAVEWRGRVTTSVPADPAAQVATTPRQKVPRPPVAQASQLLEPTTGVTGGHRLPATRTRRAALRDERPPDTDRLAGFIPLPAADGLPGFDSGMIVRVALPTASLPAFGLTIAPDATQTVNADVLVGQDGQARAIRLVSLVGGPRREPQ